MKCMLAEWRSLLECRARETSCYHSKQSSCWQFYPYPTGQCAPASIQVKCSWALWAGYCCRCRWSTLDHNTTLFFLCSVSMNSVRLQLTNNHYSDCSGLYHSPETHLVYVLWPTLNTIIFVTLISEHEICFCDRLPTICSDCWDPHHSNWNRCTSCPGAHTIEKARYTCFQVQLHEQNGKGQPDPSLETSCLHKFQHLCPAQNSDSNQTTNFDLCPPTSFDNQYNKNLQAQNGFLFSDEVLFTLPCNTLSLINLYANSQEAFFNYFTTSMLKMGRTKVLTGNEGQVHTNCRIMNVEH